LRDARNERDPYTHESCYLHRFADVEHEEAVSTVRC
jgi:hypothetical protein